MPNNQFIEERTAWFEWSIKDLGIYPDVVKLLVYRFRQSLLIQHEHDKKVMIEGIDEKLSALPSDTRIYIREKLKELMLQLK